MVKYILIASFLVLGACTTQSHDSGQDKAYGPVSFQGLKATVAERAECEAVGGEVIRTGRLGAEHCVQNLPDAGQVCSDASDCIGRCVAAETLSTPDRGTVMTGVCEATDDHFGCTTLISGGMVEGTLCVD